MLKKILIVDDSSIMRRIVRECLEAKNFQILGEARDGQDAVKQYMLLSPDAVIMDVTMKNIDGLSAAKEIFHLDPKAVIVFLSNLDSEKYAEEARKLGARGFVSKQHVDQILEFLQ